MSEHEYLDPLEKQLAEIQLALEAQSSGRVKKIPPAVPPKKKAQPQVPHSAVVSTVCEPSYSSRIQSGSSPSGPTYSNTFPSNNVHPHINYGNTSVVSHTSKITNNQLGDLSQLRPQNTYKYQTALYTNNEELPPPPPPPPQHFSSNRYDFNKNNKEFLPPPSPVSSNYSELLRATANIGYNNERTSYPPIYQNEYNPTYSGSHTSTYESLYEPINPLPMSRISSQTSPGLPNYHNSNKNTSSHSLPKEEEVDALTNLLVQSISDSQDLDIFGICVKCGGKVVGEPSGCSAMGNTYHVSCFCCECCNTNLQDKPFYAVEGRPYCEIDYYETLEKCSVCDKPILDRILRATGKPYHPACFTCVVCSKSLDGIPFTVDAMNQIHCIEDFHKKFAPRCCVCELPIMPEKGQEETVRVVALDRSFHVKCYCCEDCGILLSSGAEGQGCYPLDDHILCKNCNAHRIRMLTNVMTTDL